MDPFTEGILTVTSQIADGDGGSRTRRSAPPWRGLTRSSRRRTERAAGQRLFGAPHTSHLEQATPARSGPARLASAGGIAQPYTLRGSTACRRAYTSSVAAERVGPRTRRPARRQARTHRAGEHRGDLARRSRARGGTRRGQVVRAGSVAGVEVRGAQADRARRARRTRARRACTQRARGGGVERAHRSLSRRPSRHVDEERRARVRRLLEFVRAVLEEVESARSTAPRRRTGCGPTVYVPGVDSVTVLVRVLARVRVRYRNTRRASPRP